MNPVKVARSVPVDLMRGIAIGGMVICHTISFMSYYLQEYALSNFIGGQVFGDFPAAFFLFVAGLSLSLTLDQAEEKNSVRQWVKRNRKRGVVIFLLGFIFCLLAWGPDQLFIWGILTLAGSSIFTLTFLSSLSPRTLIGIAAGVLGISPLLRSYTHYLEDWGGDIQAVTSVLGRYQGIFVEPVREYSQHFQLKPIFFGFLANGEFAFFPWSAFVIMGFAMGRFQRRLKLKWVFFLALSLVLLGLGIASWAFHSGYIGPETSASWIAPLSFYPDSVSLFLVQLGACLVVFSLLMRGFSSDDVIRAQALGKVVWIQVFTRMSRYTLSIFFFHHLVMLWPIWWFGHQQGDAYFYYGRVMATPYAFGVAAFILIVSYALTWIWDEVAPWLSLEYWVQKVIAD